MEYKKIGETYYVRMDRGDEMANSITIPMPCSPSNGMASMVWQEDILRVIEHSVENLTLPELEALYYDMSTKNYINE